MVVEENLEQVLSYEIDRYTPFSKDEAYFAFEITTRNPETNLIRLLFAAIEKPRLQAYVARLTQLGITPAAIEVTSTAMLNTLRHTDPPKAPLTTDTKPLRVVIDLHDTGYELIITEGSQLRYTRAILKKDNTPKDIGKELEKGLVSLGQSRTNVEKIILGQTQESVNGLTTETLAKHLAMHVTTLEDFPDESPVLVGLALHGLKHDRPSINLLPEEPRPPSPRRKYAPTFILILMAGLLTLGYLTITFMNNHGELQRISDQLKKLSPQIATMTAIQDRNSALTIQLETLQNLTPSHQTALNVLKELTTVVPNENWLTNLTYKGDSITLTGRTRSSAAHLISQLENSPIFYDVNFSEPVSGEDFRIQAKVKMLDVKVGF